MKKGKNILSLLKIRSEEYGERIALGIRNKYGWSEFSYKGIAHLSKQLAYYFINGLKLETGERLAILSESKPEYGACVFASVLAGLITVPLDIKLTKYELKSILSDCEPTILLISSQFSDMATYLKQEIPSIKYIMIIDENCGIKERKTIYEIADKSTTKWRLRKASSTALIIYTSGTTGAPKGVEITFKNIISQLEDIREILGTIFTSKHAKTLSILPMNHLFEMTVGFSSFLNMGYSVYYTKSLKPNDVLSIMREKEIVFMIVVPALLRLLKSTIESNIKKKTKIHQLMFQFLFHVAKFVPSYRMKKMMFKQIHKQFGGKFAACIAGGAPLDKSVGKFFERIGIKVFQGYGLTETSPVVSVNTDRYKDLSSIGKPLKHYQAKIDNTTGELLLKGPSVMKGYYKRPEMTKEVITEDGWLHTGDIAKQNSNGHLYITGRIKNMIVLSGGKKVFPEEVESVLEKSEYISEICVIGLSKTFGAKDNTEEVAAIIIPKPQLYDLYSEKEVENLVKTDIKNLSQRLTVYKRPVNIIIKREPLPKTSTNKVKRNEVKKLLSV